MKLSMHILYDWLKPFSPIALIKEGAQVLRGSRIFSGEETTDSQNVYIVAANDFLWGNGETGVICMHKSDIIYIPTAQFDQVFNEVLRAFDFYNNWADTMRKMIDESCMLTDILDGSEDIFGEPLSILDDGYVVSAVSTKYSRVAINEIWAHMIEHQAMDMDIIVNINNLVLTKINEVNPFLLESEFLMIDCLCQNLFLHKKHIGWVAIIPLSHPHTQGRMHLLKTLGGIIEAWLRNHEDDKQMQDKTAVFSRLLEGTTYLRGELNQRIGAMGWRQEDEKLIMKIVSSTPQLDVYEPLRAALEKSILGCACILYEMSVVVIVNLRLNSFEMLLKGLVPLLRSSRSYCGFSNIFVDIEVLKKYFEQAKIAAQYGIKKTGVINRCDDYALCHMINILCSDVQTDLVHPDLPKLEEYDKLHNTEFYKTLKCYLENERNQVKTASVLNLHRNSLFYRLSKLKELITSDLDDPNVRLYMRLSFKICDERLRS